MRLCFVIADMTLRGGGERVTATLANYFVDKYKYDVEIFSIHQLDAAVPYEIDRRVRLNTSGINLKNTNTLRKLFSKLKAFKWIRRHFATHDFDYVIGIGTYPSIVVSLSKTRGARKIGYEQISILACPPVWRLFRKLTYPRLDCVVVLTADELKKVHALNRRVACIPNCRSFFPRDVAKLDKKQIISVGRLDYQKGFDVLLDVFREVHRDRPDWTLKIIGDGCLRNDLIDWVKKHDLSKAITIKSGTDEILKCYLESSIYVMTSRWEGLPLVLLEAQACGLPIISFDCPTGPRQIITDGEDGFLIENFDRIAMKESIVTLIDNAALRARFAQNARRNSERFSPVAICKKWNRLFESPSLYVEA